MTGAPASPSGCRPPDRAQEVSTLPGFDPSRIADRIAEIMWIEFCPSIRLTAEDVRHYRKIGQLALLRLREPTDEMLQGACDKHLPGRPMHDTTPPWPDERSRTTEECPLIVGCRNIWKRMIDAASGMEAPAGGETVQQGSTEGDSPTAEGGDAHA